MGDLDLPWKQNWEHIYISGAGFAGRRGSGVLRVNALAPWAGQITHPHEKPVELLRELIGKCQPLADVLDPFMGSMPMALRPRSFAARSVVPEIEERYCEIAAKRLGQEVFDFTEAA
jgi:site-specific DNA-methyltransferase (adenine-specific)